MTPLADFLTTPQGRAEIALAARLRLQPTLAGSSSDPVLARDEFDLRLALAARFLQLAQAVHRADIILGTFPLGERGTQPYKTLLALRVGLALRLELARRDVGGRFDLFYPPPPADVPFRVGPLSSEDAVDLESLFGV
jgi:hypothetical protein